jgi:4-amino-4-deoxy-L-arabinose transferase-like glycosyltransferase
VLAPIATLAVYDIGARLAGRLAGVWCAAAFAVAPFVAIPYFVQRYHDSWVDQFLPQAFGLTQQADFPSVVAVLVSVAFTVRALHAGAYREAILAGTFAGVALALKPANALFLAAPIVAFCLAQFLRCRQRHLADLCREGHARFRLGDDGGGYGQGEERGANREHPHVTSAPP